MHELRPRMERASANWKENFEGEKRRGTLNGHLRTGEFRRELDRMKLLAPRLSREIC